MATNEGLGSLWTDQTPIQQAPNFARLLQIYPEAQDFTAPEQVYGMLEDKMRKCRDYANVETRPNGESLIQIPNTPLLIANQIRKDVTGDRVFVRKEVVSRLDTAAKFINTISPGSQLQVVYGFRDLAIQTKRFGEEKAKIIEEGFEGSDDELLEAVHRRVAYPPVAGHPTGGAVDLRPLRDGKPVDMGTPIWNFDRDSYTFSPFISEEAWDNRQALRSVMVASGFTPYDGEWWHFSYGDQEWAAENKAQFAIYEQLEAGSLNFTGNIAVPKAA